MHIHVTEENTWNDLWHNLYLQLMLRLQKCEALFAHSSPPVCACYSTAMEQLIAAELCLLQ